MKHDTHSGRERFSRFGDPESGGDEHSLDRKAAILSGLHAAMDERVRSRRLVSQVGALALVLGVGGGVVGLVSMQRASGGGSSKSQISKLVSHGEESGNEGKERLDSPLAVNTVKDKEGSDRGETPNDKGVHLVVEMTSNQPGISERLMLSAKPAPVELISDDALLEQLRMRGYSAGLLRSGERVMLLEPFGDGEIGVFRGIP